MPNTEFKLRMNKRLEYWYKNVNPNPDPKLQKRKGYIAGLINKTAMTRYAARMNLPMPEHYCEVKTVDELDFSVLPERVVIKPNNSADNDCVMLFDKGREVFTGDLVPVSERMEYVRETFKNGRFIKPETRIIAEEFIQDFDETNVVPRDFKVYVAGGRSWVIQVVNRPGTTKKDWSHRYYSQDWVPYEHFQRSNAFGKVVEKPMHFDQLIRISNRIAQDIGCFMRVDFYIAKRGVVFGEFTSYPNAGLQFTPIGNNVLCDLMDRYPDPF